MVLCIALALILDPALASAQETADGSQAQTAFALDGALLAKRKRKRRRRRKKRSRRKKKTVVKPVVAKPEPKPEPKAVAPAPEKAPAQAAESDEEQETGLAVMDLRLAKGIDPSVGALLNETIISKLDAMGLFTSIISGSDMRDMIDLETQKMALGCEQDSCLAELGGALGVPYMMVSNLGRFGKQYILNIKLVAVEESKVLGRANKILADEAKVLEALPKALQEVVDAGLGSDEEEPAKPAAGVAAAAPSQAAASPSVAQPSASSGSGGALTRPLLWVGVGVMAGGAGAGYWSQQAVLSGKDNYNAVATGSDLEASNAAWDDWQSATDRHAWLQSVSNVSVVLGASLGVYSAVFGGS
jgi:hypothetical protein